MKCIIHLFSVVWLFALKLFDQLDCGSQGRIPSSFKGVAGQVHMLNMPKRGALLEAVIARLQASLGCLLSDLSLNFGLSETTTAIERCWIIKHVKTLVGTG